MEFGGCHGVHGGPPFTRLRVVQGFMDFRRGDIAMASAEATAEFVRLGLCVVEPRKPRPLRDRSMARYLKRIATAVGVHRCCS